MPKVILVPYEQKYFPDLKKWLSNDQLMEKMSLGPFSELEIEEWPIKPGHDIILIAKNESGDVIGYATYHHFSQDGKSASHGTLIDPKFQGQGYGKAVLNESVKYGFTEFGLNIIKFGVRDDNPVSKHNIESSGYKFAHYDSTKKKSYYFIEK